MARPVTPFCGCDAFVLNQRAELLLIQRSDNRLWALPGGCQNLGETAKECAIRECFEESGLRVEVDALIGVWSSQRYPYLHYPWKDNEFTHLVFSAHLLGGSETTSEESLAVGWFAESSLPELSDGHKTRIEFGFQWQKNRAMAPYFE